MFGVDVLKRKEEAKIRHIEDILKNNLNKIRVSFSELFLSAEFRENLKIEKVNELHDRIKSIFEAKDDLASFEAHKENFEHFLQTGDIKTPLALKDEESQLYWGIALGYLAAHPEIQSSWDERHQASKLSDTTLWRRIESSSYMQKELKKHAYIIKRSVDNPDAKIIWSEMGYPNISYCFNRKNNVIIDDMLWTLVCGVDAAATAINHEIAHSQGTQFLESPKMEQLKLEQDALLKEVEEKSKAKDDEGWLKAVKLATRKRIEYQYRFRFLDELENMFANRYSVEFGGDYDKAHLNELETVINLGQKFIAPKNIKEAKKELSESAQKRIEHVKAIARNTFFMNNEILNKENELGSLHLYPELLDGYDEKGVKMSASEAFDEIKEICLKFENKQPSPVLKEDNPGMYAVRMKKLSKERSQLVDVFFDRFVAHHMEEIYKEAEKQIEESFKQAKMMQNQMQQGGQNGQGNQQQGGQQESQNGQQNGQQEGQNGQQNGQQEGQDGQQEVQDGQQEGQGGQQEGQDGQQEGQDGQQEGQDGQQEGQGGQQEGQGDQQEGQGGQQEGQDGQQEGQGGQQ